MQNMKSVENTRRELFEDWYESYTAQGWSVSRVATWKAFNAALDSVVIQLPLQGREYDRADEYYNMGIVHCMDAIESTNLGIKVK